MLYSLTAVTRELLALRQPALAQLQEAASWASSACSKVRPEGPGCSHKSMYSGLQSASNRSSSVQLWISDGPTLRCGWVSGRLRNRI